MYKKLWSGLACLIFALAIYLSAWPVETEPVSWKAPIDAGYVGDFAPNTGLSDITRINLNGHDGPEDVAIGPDGQIYAATHDGFVVRYDPGTGAVNEFINTGGRPLGIEFDSDGWLYIADAYLGLMKVSASGETKLLTDKMDADLPINYANSLDIDDDGSVYFTNASTKFGAKVNGGTFPASLLDLMEHGGHGRVLKFDPSTGATTTVAAGLNFANGIALTADKRHIIVVETGSYRVLKIRLQGGGEPVPIVDNLPGFPDNISRNADGTFWLGLASPRSKIVDDLSGYPFVRKVIQRLPAFMRPNAKRYGFVVRFDENGNILETLQDPSGTYALTTGLVESADGTRYISSLTEPELGVLNATK